MLAYLFDIDGTILLTGGAGTRALNRVFQERYGVQGAMDAVRPGGKTDPLIVAEIFALTLGRDAVDGEIDEILDVYVPYLEQEVARSDRFRLMPSAPDAVRWLAERVGIPLGLATGNVQAAARLKLARCGLWEHFAYGGFGDDSGDRAELVAHAMARGRGMADRELADRDFVIVGDTPRDVAAARACGARVVVVPTGSYGRDELAACEPDALLETLAELPAWHRSQAR